MEVELLAGTRYAAKCDICDQRRKIVEDLRLVACGCIVQRWLRLYPDEAARGLILEATSGQTTAL